MSKVSTANQITERWHLERMAKHRRTYSAAGSPDRNRWAEIVRVHRRRVLRRNGLRNRAARVAVKITERDFWAEAIRSNRNSEGLPPQVFRISHSGVISDGQ